MARILITGGAGFIGSHISEKLISRGDNVRVLDRLLPQVHGASDRPDYLHDDVELRVGDVCDREAVACALDGVDAVIHLAAAVGVGQSMYEMASYTLINDVGTAILLEELARKPVSRLVCASSMSIYGEGLARRADGRLVNPAQRSLDQLKRGDWELRDGAGILQPVATPETKDPCLTSVYALTKYSQERLCLIFGQTYNVPTVALRLFNVYGPHQALSNPYTGVLAIFGSRLLNRRAPLVFEDGNQMRDFVHVSDVARAFVLALHSDEGVGQAINVGSGESRTITSIAQDLADVTGLEELQPQITGKYRAGDIRHCFSNIQLARERLGYEPQVPFREGIGEFAAWLKHQAADDEVERATAELESRGLVA